MLKPLSALDPKIVGKLISLDESSYQVIGVMAESANIESDEPPDVWLAFPIDANSSHNCC